MIPPRIRLDPSAPEAIGACDRCQFLYNLSDLRWQLDYRGMQLQSTGFLVCETCYDIPNAQRKPIILPPDPVPVLNPRPYNYDNAEVDYLATETDDHIVEQDSDPIIAQLNGDDMLDFFYGGD